MAKTNTTPAAMTPEQMTDDQLHAQLERARIGIGQWTGLIQNQMAGNARKANELSRHKLHCFAQDLLFEINRRK